MKVFIAGGTGALGGHAVPALVGAGHEVSALARTPEKAAVLSGQGATPVRVSLFDRDGLTRAFDGHDAVVNIATAIPPPSRYVIRRAWRDNDRIRTQGSAAVVDAALAAGVGRIVQESVSMIYRDHGSEWIDEDAPVEIYPVSVPCLAAEGSVRRFGEAGGTGVVLRFGVFCGPGASNSALYLALARRHVAPLMGPPGAYVSTIHLSDGAAAVVAALDAPAGTFNVVDDEPLTQREYAAAVADAAATRPWLFVPGRAAGLLGSRTMALTSSMRVSNGRFRAATGWTPAHRSAREAWAATANDLLR